MDQKAGGGDELAILEVYGISRCMVILDAVK